MRRIIEEYGQTILEIVGGLLMFTVVSAIVLTRSEGFLKLFGTLLKGGM
ncbi:hypothetical protein SAMN04487761_10633 [Lachnospiraceae bacterium C7]|nr:hypothetical protein SAMN04487761_10633 [Lachnospiraceae bacterium C7]